MYDWRQEGATRICIACFLNHNDSSNSQSFNFFAFMFTFVDQLKVAQPFSRHPGTSLEKENVSTFIIKNIATTLKSGEKSIKIAS